MSFRLLRQQNTLSRCALRIPRESGSPLPVKSVKARFRYSPLCSETGMTVTCVCETAQVMPVFAPTKYRYPAVPCTSREIPALRLPVKSVKYEQENCHPGLRAGISLFFYSEVVRNDSDLGAKNSPCHAGFCTSKIPLSRCAMHIPRDSGSPLPVKSIKYEQEIGVYRFRIGVRNDKGALVQNRHAPARMSRWISLFCQLDRPTALRR
jgi:hypothetical protein